MQRLQQLLHNYDATFRDQAILLIAACRTQYAAEPAKDLVFLFCHQIVCLAFTDTNVTPREIWRFPNIGAALELLFRMLIPFPRDSVAGKDYMKYFSDFPAPNATSSQWNLYPALLEETLQFIHRFCENNVGFTQTCIASQRLPLPDDIEGFFGVRSAGLQKVIYRW